MNPGLPRRATAAIAAGFLVLFVLLCWDAMRDKSAAFDEPALMAGGYSCLAPGGRDVATANLRLSELWLALPLLPFHPHLPDSVLKSPGLTVGLSPTDVGPDFLYDPRNNADAMLRASRLAVTALAVALGWVLFAWSRRLHGDAAGL